MRWQDKGQSFFWQSFFFFFFFFLLNLSEDADGDGAANDLLNVAGNDGDLHHDPQRVLDGRRVLVTAHLLIKQ
jgi:hypothetical protein